MHLNFVEKQITRTEFFELCRKWIAAFSTSKPTSNRMQEEGSTSSETDLFESAVKRISSATLNQAFDYPMSFENPVYREFLFELISRHDSISGNRSTLVPEV